MAGLEGVGWWGTIVSAIASALPQGGGVYEVGPTPTYVAPPDLGPTGGFNFRAAVPTPAGGSPGQPPIGDIPQAPAVPEPPIVAGPGSPGVPPPSTANPNDLAGMLGPWIGGTPIALASGKSPESDRILRELARELAKPSWARNPAEYRGKPRKPTRAARAAQAARRLESQVGRAVVAGLGVIGAGGQAVLAGIGGLLYPSPTANDVPLEELVLDPRVYRRLPVPKPPKPDVITYTRRTPPSTRPKIASRGSPSNPKIRPKGAGPAPMPTGDTGSGPALPVPAPAPTTPSGQNVTPSTPRAVRTIQRAMSNPAARNAIQALDLLSMIRQGRTPSAPRQLDPVTPSLPTPAAPPLTGLNPQLLSSTATRPATTSSSCQCGPKKRGKPRKCLARAQVVWKGGRQKGKVAGTKCLSFEN